MSYKMTVTGEDLELVRRSLRVYADDAEERLRTMGSNEQLRIEVHENAARALRMADAIERGEGEE